VLEACAEPLAVRHDLTMLDLDGVVYIGETAVPGAVEAITDARDLGTHLAFVTNNASRPPTSVRDRLEGLGIAADVSDVVTSAQAAAGVLRERLGDGAPVHVVGGSGLLSALDEAGLVASDLDGARAVVTGYGPDVVWSEVMRAAVAIREGTWWVASNTDLTIPTPYGVAPGHGALVGLLQRFAGVDPVVAGKPAPPLLQETIQRVGGSRPLMVGDRLDTDIAGAHAVSVPSLLVLTGVTGLAELVAARPDERPTYLDLDLAGLLVPQPEVASSGLRASCGGWDADTGSGGLQVHGSGDAVDWWRAAAVAAWAFLDETGRSVDTTRVAPPGADPLDG